MNTTAFGVLMVGLLLGMKHATEADHLAAVATLVARRQPMAQTLRLGVAWGIGHTLTLMGFGGAVLLLGAAVPPRLEQALETAVGVMLVLLGLDLLRRLARERIHFHRHRHASAPAEHVHAHSHRDERVPHQRSAHEHEHASPRWPLRALAVGMVHGLAGSAALVVLGMQSAPSLAVGLGYILLFGLGSIAGMAALSVVIAWPLQASARRMARLHAAMTALVSLASCAVGVWLVVETGYLQSLWA